MFVQQNTGLRACSFERLTALRARDTSEDLLTWAFVHINE